MLSITNVGAQNHFAWIPRCAVKGWNFYFWVWVRSLGNFGSVWNRNGPSTPSTVCLNRTMSKCGPIKSLDTVRMSTSFLGTGTHERRKKCHHENLLSAFLLFFYRGLGERRKCLTRIFWKPIYTMNLFNICIIYSLEMFIFTPILSF